MIIRKPYAFLIKNFKKIHIFLLILSLYVLYQIINVNNFINEFMRLGTYDFFSDPITNHITWYLTLSIILLIIGSVSILFLLNHKKKPWKIYLIPIIQYFLLLFVLGVIKSFFNSYSTDVETTDLRMAKDLLTMFIIVQLPVIGVYVMRVFGLDVKKFNFNSDQEFLELSEADREEIEIGVSIDKDSFIRKGKKIARHLNYFYQEHKYICNWVFGIGLLIVIGLIYTSVFVTHKTYKQGEFYNVNGYSFKVNNVYYTDKDYNGNIISKKSNFIILDLTIKNNSEPRTVNLDYFHIKNKTKDYVTTEKVFAKEFQDLGNVYDTVTKLKRNEILDCIVVYKVDNYLNKNKFVLYYQESNGYLRKIKLKVTDLSKISDPINLNLGDSIEVDFKNEKDTISFDIYSIGNVFTYSTKECSAYSCEYTKNEINGGSKKILKIDFGSEVWESKNMIDFLTQYGKLIYKDSNDVEGTIEIDNPIDKTYYGKTVFLKIPGEVEDAKELSIDLIIRDKHYVYKLF